MKSADGPFKNYSLNLWVLKISLKIVSVIAISRSQEHLNNYWTLIFHRVLNIHFVINNNALIAGSIYKVYTYIILECQPALFCWKEDPCHFNMVPSQPI